MKLPEANVAREQAVAKRWVPFVTGAVLSFSAGTVNGAATVALVFERTTHMSGRVNDLLRDLVFDPPEGLLVACLVGSFVLGAFFAGMLVPRRGVTPALLGTAVLLAAAGAATWTGEVALDGSRYIVASLLALAAGLQNGATSQVAVGRTTHVTGDLTDLAIAMAAGDRGRAAFLLAKLTAFSGGGIAGFMGIRHGHLALVLLLCALTVVAGLICLQQLERRLSLPMAAEASGRRSTTSDNRYLS
ncbi:MAG: DUF1275 family protein [Bacillota bacterium]